MSIQKKNTFTNRIKLEFSNNDLFLNQPRSQGDAWIADIFVVFVVNLITVQNVVRFGKIVQLTAKITVLQVSDDINEKHFL